jgi:TonB family protein
MTKERSALSDREHGPSGLGRIILGLIENTGAYFLRPPSIFDQTPPVYPDFAKRNHITGEVVLDALIAKNGMVESVTPVSGNPALRQAAMDAVRRWRFTPGTIGGKTTEMEDRVSVTFSFGPTSKK